MFDPKNDIVMRIATHTRIIAELTMGARDVTDPRLQARIIERLASEGVALARACAALFLDCAADAGIEIPGKATQDTADNGAN